MAVLEAIESTATECLASSGGGNQVPRQGHTQAVPGWTAYVKPFSDDSKFWFATWGSAGKPIAGALHEAMLYSKRQ